MEVELFEEEGAAEGAPKERGRGERLSKPRQNSAQK